MGHGYQALQQWQQWLTSHQLGAALLTEEARVIQRLVSEHYGKHVLLIGVPAQQTLLNASPLAYRSLLSPIYKHDIACNLVEGDFHHLPFQTGSVDLVLLPHTLQLVENARQLLSETCRIIKPEGLIVVLGFNPYSLLGVKKIWSDHKKMPFSLPFIRKQLVKNWLRLADFQLEEEYSFLFKPPFFSGDFSAFSKTVDRMMRFIFPSMGGVYALSARAKVLPLQPIRMKWTQKANALSFPSSIPGNFAQSILSESSNENLDLY